jgi:predicted acylesterase/phospholipase RssA
MDITFENVDAIYAIVDNREQLDLNPHIKKFFQSDKFPFISRKALVILHEAELSATPINTQHWLEKENFTLHHHVRYKNSTDFQRLLRFIIEKPNGLVLSGGGTKLWASVGIIHALETLKIPIDVIAGTSAGAILGGLWSLSQNHETVKELAHLITTSFDNLFKLNNLSYPILSVNNGRKFTESLQSVFKDINIEDLWLPNFYICCDLSTGEELCLSRGPLWKALRASSSLPLIFPPVVNNGHLYVDGGLLNNMPVDQMRNRICQSCFIIAVDLSVPPFQSNYNFPPIISFTTGLGARLKLQNKDYIYPPLLETFLNSLLIGSSSKTEKNGLIADVLLKPDISKFSMIKINKNNIADLIKDSFQFAINELENITVDEDTGILSLSFDNRK